MKANICYLYFVTNPTLGKILVLKLWAKMLVANQIAGFFKFFGIQINNEVFYKLILSFWMCLAMHARSTPKQEVYNICNICNIFAIYISLQYFLKNSGMKSIFCMQIKTKVFYKLLV